MIEILEAKEGSIIKLSETKDWYTWINLMPPPPHDFHVIGEVMVPNPGVKAFLTPTVPQGFNPAILFLDIVLVQQPGYWPQAITWVEAKYEKTVRAKSYDSITIFSEGEPIDGSDVEEIH